jgi:L-threonylcarbamoyladenylate synthase
MSARPLAQHVRDEFGADGTLAMVLDGGQSQVGIESTIVDLSRLATHGPVLLRPGHISADAIAAVIDRCRPRPTRPRRAPRARSNRITRRTPRWRCRTARSCTPRWPAAAAGRKVALVHYSDFPAAHASLRLPATPDGFAHALYAALRALDSSGAD